MDKDLFWQLKLAARLHDPAEKALVLLRDPAGHENGTSLALARLLGLFEPQSEQVAPDAETALAAVIFREGIPRDLYRILQRADWWAAAADRPQWPMESAETGGFKVVSWAQVRWSERPVLIHPLSGESFELPGGLSELELEDVKRRSFEHFAGLLKEFKEGSRDWRKIALAFWRFGPELEEVADFGKLGELWKLLPADTRVPDHSVWDHLDLVSAFAGAFASDGRGEAGLLAFSVGPVQSFIEAARKIDDLWAGSHLLSRLTWEAAKPICEELGPDAILYPRLRGLALVDLWLRDEMGLPPTLFEGLPWKGKPPDANPLFAAALPNRFIAIVPADRAAELAEACRQRARRWLLDLGLKVVDRLLEEVGSRDRGAPRDESVPAYEQMRCQVEAFPEIHWAAVPFSLVRPKDSTRPTELDVEPLKAAMAPFYGVEPREPAGFLKSDPWKLLAGEIDLPDGTAFYRPNPGVLYPALYEVTERLLAAAKSVRPFDQRRQEGWRCTLTGETEWLTTDRSHLNVPRGSRRSRNDKRGFRDGEHVETLWTRIADAQPSWAKSGEHLGALPAIKRLWPTLFAEEVRQDTGGITSRFVVSTHAMALAHQLEAWLERPDPEQSLPVELRERLSESAKTRVALPRRLTRLRARGEAEPGEDRALRIARQLVELLEEAQEAEQKEDKARDRALVRRAFATEENAPEGPSLETYYALLLMDGDRMGAILSGDKRWTIEFRQSFHPQISQAVADRFHGIAALEKYLVERRPVSPSRHLAISGALNDFSQVVVPHIVEEIFPGRLIYAGGDDVMAMFPVADVLHAAQRLRWAYSGEFPEDRLESWDSLHRRGQLAARSGFALLRGRLMRMMGPRATASCGIVVAHHLAPLAFVLRELRLAERKAKSWKRERDGRTVDRDALHVTIVKRSGNTLNLTLDWGEPVKLLQRVRTFLADPSVSRRAVYHTLEWLAHLPVSDGAPDREMLECMLKYQLSRQAGKPARELAPPLATDLAAQAVKAQNARDWLENFLCVAEFLAREQRSGGGDDSN
jgi:CRISPR-associated protein Cmr2